jgi:cell division septation protein DedD
MDIALKQRLVGAVVLIALAVVVLPMLLGGRPEQSAQEAQKIELPPQPSELDFQTRRYPVGEAATAPSRNTEEDNARRLPDSLPQPEVEPGAVTHVEIEPRAFQDALQEDAGADGAESPASGTAPLPAQAEPRSAPTPVAAEQPARGLTEPPAASGGRYVVQIASFGSIGNANRLADTLRGQGYSVLSDTVRSDVGTLHRVRIGPYGTEAEANAAVAQVRQQVGDVKPRVVDLRPEQAAQVTTPSDPLVRWVVQLGSFSSTDNADRLVAKVRAEGHSAYKEAVSSSGSTVYRVRVGPFLKREEAIRVDGLIAERLSLDGVVMSAD